MAAQKTREQWLNQLVTALRPMFKKAGAPIPKKVLVSVGFPSRGGTSSNKLTIGQCWTPTKKVPHIFISPLLHDPIVVCATVVHELVHAAVGCEHGHKKPFKDVAVALGLTGKMTATVAGDELKQKLKPIIAKLGKYHHEALKPNPNAKKPGSRLKKAECPSCGYTIRVTKKWIEVGLPTCPCGDDIVEEGA